MLWLLAFWLTFALLVLPLPFKLCGYINGKDKSATIVKVEETLSALFLSFGLIAFYGFTHNLEIFSPVVWQVWFVFAVFFLYCHFFGHQNCGTHLILWGKVRRPFLRL